MKKQSLVLSAVAALLAVLVSGCAAVLVGAAAGAGAVAYKAGELISTESASIDKTWTANEKAFKELQLLGEAKEKDGLAARMEATGAGDKRIVVKLRNKGEKLTEVRIRIGVFGDEGYSRKILEKIKENL
jgi:uncharacterized protein YceK